LVESSWLFNCKVWYPRKYLYCCRVFLLL